MHVLSVVRKDVLHGWGGVDGGGGGGGREEEYEKHGWVRGGDVFCFLIQVG